MRGRQAFRLTEVEPLTAEQRRLLESEPDVARKAALAIVKRYGWLLPEAEMLQASELAVAEAARSHDPARGPFGRWAFYRACHGILDACAAEKKDTALIRTLRTAVLSRLQQGGPRSEAEAPLEVFGQGQSQGEKRLSRFCDELVGTAFEHGWMCGGEESLAARQEAANAARALREALGELPKWQRQMLALRFEDEVSSEEIARRLGMSERNTRRKFREAEGLLRARLKAAGITSMPAWFPGEGGGLLRAADEEP